MEKKMSLAELRRRSRPAVVLPNRNRPYPTTIENATPAQIKKYLREQDAQREKHGYGPNKRVLGDISFIDRAGSIVHPTKRDFEAQKARISGGYATPERKQHYDSTRTYESSGESSRYHRHHDLSQELSIISLAGLFSGIFFLSPNITGSAIANTTIQNSSILGAAFLIIGLISGYFYVKNRKKK
jgi:hypothetical protein